MKHIALILIALALVTLTASAQTAVTTTLSSTVTAYADGDIILGAALISTPVPIFGDSPEGYIIGNDCVVDSIFTGTIEFMALSDTVGVLQTLAADNAAFVMTAGVKAKYIGSTTISFTAGATSSYGTSQWIHKYRLTAASKAQKKMYWLAIARSAWTYKQACVLQFTAWFEPDKVSE